MTQTFARLAMILFALATTYWFAPHSANAGDPVPIPELALWEADLLQFGELQSDNFRAASGEADTYYDAARVFYQAADYFGDPEHNGTPWAGSAHLAAVKYRTTYHTQIAGGGADPWNKFTHGLRWDFERTGDQASKDAVVHLATTGLSKDYGMSPPYTTFLSARENAYALQALLDHELLGEPRQPRADQLVDILLNMLGNRFGGDNPPPIVGDSGIQPMMIGLIAEALTQYHEQTPDARVLPALKNAATKLYDWTWVPEQGGFVYDTAGGPVYPGLNMLIAPMYAWVYKETEETSFREMGDEIFSQGVFRTHCASTDGPGCTVSNSTGGFLQIGKHFNQQYRWSFKYVEWRSGSATVPEPAAFTSVMTLCVAYYLLLARRNAT